MWVIPSCMFMWFMWERLIQKVSGERFSQKWSSNLVSATHSVAIIIMCMSALREELDPVFIFVVSTSYFLYDIRNYEVGTVYYMHHIFSIVGILHGVTSDSDMLVALAGYLFTEFGNFPVYVMYCLFTHPNKAYLDRWYDIILVWEFVWFVVFRIIIVSWILTSAVQPLTIFLGVTLQIANIKWVSGMYNKIRQSFST
jgi:hypothetical protein